MDKTIEELTHETLLQASETVRLGRHTYKIAPPSIATMVVASALISRLPRMEISERKEDVVIEVLRHAKDSRLLGLVMATMVMGVKRQGLPVSSLIRGFRTRRCARLLLENLSPNDMLKLAYKLFGRMEVQGFFGLIAFLNEVNMTKATKATTTASGQPSEVS